MSKQELEQLEYNDTLIGLHSICEQYGAREVLRDFRATFPEMFEELVVQINRLPPPPKAALLRP
jgi:hypothetical protein